MTQQKHIKKNTSYTVSITALMKSKGNRINCIQFMNKIDPYWTKTTDNKLTEMTETKMDNQQSYIISHIEVNVCIISATAVEIKYKQETSVFT